MSGVILKIYLCVVELEFLKAKTVLNKLKP